MAKNKDHVTDAPATTSGPTSVTIATEIFAIAAPFTEGHVLSAPEAKALNQTFAENVRNNFASKVKKAKEAGSFNHEALQAELSAYAGEYSFATKRTARAPVDPVQKEAHKIASGAVTEALKRKNIDKKSLKDGKFDELVANYLAKAPEILHEAKRRIESANKVALTLQDEDLAA